ncbi:unnamed protein product, partial [Didymodactylos carnosus]
KEFAPVYKNDEEVTRKPTGNLLAKRFKWDDVNKKQEDVRYSPVIGNNNQQQQNFEHSQIHEQMQYNQQQMEQVYNFDDSRNTTDTKMKKIDIHTHILPSSLTGHRKQFGYNGWLELIHRSDGKVDMIKDGELFRVVEPNCFNVDVRLKEMDENHIQMQVLSTVPVLFSYWAKGEDALVLSEELNNHIADVCRTNPERFIGLGTVPLQSPELAVRELRRCVEQLGLKGVQIGSHVNDWNLDNEQLDPFWKEVEQLDCCVFVHPWDMDMSSQRHRDYWLPWLCAMPFETTSAICSILMGGILEKYPKLRLVFAHGGGQFPFTIGRIDHGHQCRPDLCAKKNSKTPSSYIGKLYVDSLAHDKRALKYLVDIMGNECVMLGSDYPFPLGEDRPGQLIVETFENDETLKEKLLYKNAQR